MPAGRITENVFKALKKIKKERCPKKDLPAPIWWELMEEGFVSIGQDPLVLTKKGETVLKLLT